MAASADPSVSPSGFLHPRGQKALPWGSRQPVPGDAALPGSFRDWARQDHHPLPKDGL